MTLEGLESLRQDAIKEMEKLTAYTDIFQAYEYVMNRVEGRFMPQLVGKKPEDMETFMDEVIQYLAGTSDPADFHERFQLIISQLPVRFTKNKFFALVEEGMSVYKGAPEAGLEDMIYVLRSEALLNRPLASDGDCKTGEGIIKSFIICWKSFYRQIFTRYRQRNIIIFLLNWRRLEK